ncbi:unnamed protein product [Symbiodinium sp. CCMP2592]|nr:unnamed protein product [Symbiodinium sp. CCMP2592]
MWILWGRSTFLSVNPALRSVLPVLGLVECDAVNCAVVFWSARWGVVGKGANFSSASCDARGDQAGQTAEARFQTTHCKEAHQGSRLSTSAFWVPVFMSLQIWVVISSLFVFTENSWKSPSQAFFASVPSSMYWTSSFLIGEWTLADFSRGAGSRVCICTALCGTTGFAIPMGILMEGVKQSMVVDMMERNSHSVNRLAAAVHSGIPVACLGDLNGLQMSDDPPVLKRDDAYFDFVALEEAEAQQQEEQNKKQEAAKITAAKAKKLRSLNCGHLSPIAEEAELDEERAAPVDYDFDSNVFGMFGRDVGSHQSTKQGRKSDDSKVDLVAELLEEQLQQASIETRRCKELAEMAARLEVEWRDYLKELANKADEEQRRQEEKVLPRGAAAITARLATALRTQSAATRGRARKQFLLEWHPDKRPADERETATAVCQWLNGPGRSFA